MCSNRENQSKCDNFTEIQIFENLKTITVGQVMLYCKESEVQNSEFEKGVFSMIF